MPDMQEAIALGIVAVVAGRLLWGFWARRKSTPQAGGKAGGKAGDCGDCTAAGPPQKEATVHFYRRRNAEGPASGAPEDRN